MLKVFKEVLAFTDKTFPNLKKKKLLFLCAYARRVGKVFTLLSSRKSFLSMHQSYNFHSNYR